MAWLCSKNHQRAIESMQASLEVEIKGKAEALRLKKKLEGEVNELEIQLDAANRGNADKDKLIKKLSNDLKVSPTSPSVVDSQPKLTNRTGRGD